MIRRHHFTKDQITQLIQEVKKHPCLWNKEHASYNNIFHAGTAWIAIAEQLGLSESTVKLKWKNLRDNFNRMICKNPHYATYYTGDWPHFHDMMFLYASRKRRKTYSAEVLEVEDQDYVILNVSEDSAEVLPYSDEFYDHSFLVSLASYFERLEPVRRVAMRAKIQDMLMKEISEQIGENSQEEG